MRRLVVMATALAVLVGAVSAYAASSGFNTYTAKLSFSPNKAGSSTAPSALGWTEVLGANGTAGNRTAPLTDIKTTFYGLTSNGKDFPTCSLSTISAAKSDTGCPKGALVATGSITALLGPVSDQSASNPTVVPCDPLLDVWNAGQGKVVFFFVDQAPSHLCAGGAVPTGYVGPFPGTIKTVGKNLVENTPIPTYVSFPLSGVEGSLTSETLHWTNLKRKVKGKTVYYTQSVGCKSGKRPYSVAYTAEQNGTSQTGTVTGSAKCS
ncbi:MAG TPA: hypothetical protein VEF89_14345 [Solirubrobacteraceae bacterium]|nr:hypothetical protein [Solirubrobacteraceae bacterium]